MSQLPPDLRYTKTHEWLRTLPDGRVEIGITDHAQQSLGDLVFVEVPEPGKSLKEGDACGVVESVKAASDVYAPIECTVTEGNSQLTSAPEAVNNDPYGAGWLMRVRPASATAVDGLMSAADYDKFVQSEST